MTNPKTITLNEAPMETLEDWEDMFPSEILNIDIEALASRWGVTLPEGALARKIVQVGEYLLTQGIRLVIKQTDDEPLRYRSLQEIAEEAAEAKIAEIAEARAWNPARFAKQSKLN